MFAHSFTLSVRFDFYARITALQVCSNLTVLYKFAFPSGRPPSVASALSNTPNRLNNPSPSLKLNMSGDSAFNVDVQRVLKENMNLQSLVEISALSAQDRTDAKFEIRRRVDRQLEHFKLDPAVVFTALDIHGAIISGSTALAVLFPDDKSFFGNDIDFYLAEDNVAPFVSDMLANTDYKIVKSIPSLPPAHYPVGIDREDPTYACLIAKSILWLQNEDGRSMNIIETLDDHPFKIIPTFYTTLVMNAITHKGLVCFYPELTMERVGVVKQSVMMLPQRTQANVAKYAARGFNISSSWDCPSVLKAIGLHVCGRARCCPWTLRDTRAEDAMLWMAFGDHNGTSPSSVVPPMRWSHYIVYVLSDAKEGMLSRLCPLPSPDLVSIRSA
ncbi:hypothetical protein NMY22_g13491 [Coprinellus aureogranulatus]|nr:hypothetical protein NMY22_g13491 [Coprinellus aureogranulatus]